MNKASVLFVCLGNICRSPLAEAAMRQHAERLGLECLVDSAGTGDWHIGKPPDMRAQNEARRQGNDISALRARQVQPVDFMRFSHILALDHQNLDDLQAMAPANATASLSLLLDHLDGCEGQAVADPYFGDADGFRVTWDQVSAATGALAAKLARHD